MVRHAGLVRLAPKRDPQKRNGRRAVEGDPVRDDDVEVMGDIPRQRPLDAVKMSVCQPCALLDRSIAWAAASLADVDVLADPPPPLYVGRQQAVKDEAPDRAQLIVLLQSGKS
jgi:hypothetical protein